MPPELMDTIVKRVVDNYQPDKIILFGSHAYDNPTPESDIDWKLLTEGRCYMNENNKIKAEEWFEVRYPFSKVLVSLEEVKVYYEKVKELLKIIGEE